MRVLFTSFPAFGHLHPLMPLALAARDAGHDVRVATGPNLADWVTRCGGQVSPIGMSEDALAEVADRDHAGPERTLRMFTDVWVSRTIDDLLDLTVGWKPDVVVHEEEEYSGPLLASILHIPCVTQSWAAPVRPAAGRVAALRALTPLWDRFAPGRVARRIGDLYLDACPALLQSVDIAKIAESCRVVAVRPGSFDGPPSSPPTFLADLARPAAYVTLGTVAVFSDPRLLSRISSALAARFASVVVTTGPNPVEALDNLPENVYPLPYVAQSQVLPAVDLLVSHGGAGGTCGALMHGLPHLILPGHGQSQITIADAVHRCGLGIRLDNSSRGAKAITDAAHRLLTDNDVRIRVRALQVQLLSLPDANDVLPVVLTLATPNAPQAPRTAFSND